MTSKRASDFAIWVVLSPLIALVIAVALPFFAAYGVFNLCRGFWLRTSFRRKWGPEGKSILFVYSESPNWQAYIERELLPKLAPGHIRQCAILAGGSSGD
jgi:hypothetical protein